MGFTNEEYKEIELLFTLAKSSGCEAIPALSGCFIETGRNLSLQQKDWADGDSAKNTDFTLSNFWLTDDYGRFPTTINAKDLKDLLSE